MEQDKKGTDLNQVALLDPKITFINQAYIVAAGDDESIHFTFACDNVGVGRFAFHPKHAKRFFLLLKKTIEDYEQRNGGEIRTELPT